MSDTYASDKASDLIKSDGRRKNAEERFHVAETSRAAWEPEFTLVYQDNDPKKPHICAKIGGKVTYIEVTDVALAVGDPDYVAKQYAEFAAKKFAALIHPLITREVSKAMTAYRSRKKLESGSL